MMVIPASFRSETAESAWWDNHADVLQQDSSHLAMLVICATMGMDTVGADFELAKDEAARAISEYIRWSHHAAAKPYRQPRLCQAA